MSKFIIGVDLGQARDYTALCVLESNQVESGKTQKVYKGPLTASYRDPEDFIETPIMETRHDVRHLERFRDMPYPKQVERIKELSPRLKVQGEQAAALVVDQTGVGRPVVDMLRAAGLKPIAITITGGDSVSRDGLDYRVPKRDLVSVAQVLLQSERLKIASSLPLATTLTAELLAFKVTVSLKGHDSYGNDVGLWRENEHDDLVLATALACWYGEQPTRRRSCF